ncbi:MAG TPA: methylmalonyl Co-A mutase-associated GTPase MeaB [Kofleriaceae bacterium]
MTARRPRLSLDEYEKGVRAADRGVLAQAVTLVESRNADDAVLAQELLTRLMPHTGGARRIGITGVPGVGKSTFIDELGTRLIAAGKKVAVLAIDPSSQLTGGSILGDKTRMERLSLAENAFIRPSPSGLSPGGVARRTRETLLLCEAAGFDVVLVETVGVGQGETAVADMVDCFLVLALPGAGDELQGIKKGVFELADVIAVNKADGDNTSRAKLALSDLRSALRYLPKKRASWGARAVAVSGITGTGVDELWQIVEEHHTTLSANGELAALRADQQKTWMWSLIRERLEAAFRAHPDVAAALPAIELAVSAGTTSSTAAADTLLELSRRR